MLACPSSERLQQWLDRQLTGRDAAVVEVHVNGCPPCQARLESLSRDPALDAWLSKRPARGEAAPPGTFVQGLCAGEGLDTDPEATGDASAASGRPRLAGYEILGELGHGGMGVVYQARQVGLDRQVALKMIRASQGADQRAVARFRIEAQTVARLQHPNVVQIFEVGEQDGQPYLVLEFVEGGTLAARLAGTPLPPQPAAELLEVLARAIAYAHERGVVHRDLKPANVLLTPDGTPKITDFGLARWLDEDSGPSNSGSLLGTPSYMAPEQAAGGKAAVAPLVDVYALGAVLYELLTGRPPFKGATPLETVQQVAWEEPVPPARLQPRLPRDLETVCLKCLHKEPRRRYASALEVAEDLQRFLAGKPIRARRTGPLGQGWRWCRRNPALAVVSGLAAAALVAVTLVSVLFAFAQADTAALLHKKGEQTRRALEDMTRQRALAEDRRREAEEGQALLAFDRGLQLCENGSPDQGAFWLNSGLDFARRARAGELQHSLRIALGAWGQLLHTLRGNLEEDGLEVLAIAPQSRTALTRDPNQGIRVWDLSTSRPLGPPLTHPGLCLAACSPDGRVVLTAGTDRSVWLRDAATSQAVCPPLPPLDSPLMAAVFSRDGRIVVTATTAGTARCWHARTGAPLGPEFKVPAGKRLLLSADGKKVVAFGADKVHGPKIPASAGDVLQLYAVPTGAWLGSVQAGPPVAFPSLPGTGPTGERPVALSGDGKYLLVAGVGGARLWATDGCRLLHHFPAMTPRTLVLAVALSADGQTAAVGSIDGVARLWDVNTGKPRINYMRHQHAIFALDLSPDGRVLLTAGADRLVRLWDLATRHTIGGPLRHRNCVTFAAFSPDGQSVLTGSGQTTARLWQLAPLPWGEGVLPATPHSLCALGYLPQGGAYAATSDGTVSLWSGTKGAVRSLSCRRQMPLHALAPSGEGRAFLAGYADGSVWRWPAGADEPRELVPPRGPEGEGRDPKVERSQTKRPVVPINALAVSADGQLLLTGAADGTARLWDATTGQPLGRPFRHRLAITSVALSPNAKTVLTGSADWTAQFWDAATGAPRGAPLRHELPVLAAAFSPDGRTAVTGSEDGKVRLWDTATGQLRGAPLEHVAWVMSVAFSPDGRYLLTGSADGAARLWDPRTGRRLSPSYRNAGLVCAVAFSPDGQHFLAGCHDGSVRRWPVPTPKAGAPEQIQRALEETTGMALDAGQAIRVLDAADWQQRRQRLGK